MFLKNYSLKCLSLSFNLFKVPASFLSQTCMFLKFPCFIALKTWTLAAEFRRLRCGCTVRSSSSNWDSARMSFNNCRHLAEHGEKNINKIVKLFVFLILKIFDFLRWRYMRIAYLIRPGVHGVPDTTPAPENNVAICSGCEKKKRFWTKMPNILGCHGQECWDFRLPWLRMLGF